MWRLVRASHIKTREQWQGAEDFFSFTVFHILSLRAESARSDRNLS